MTRHVAQLIDLRKNGKKSMLFKMTRVKLHNWLTEKKR